MNRLKKLAGIINEDQEQGLMNKVNKISDPQAKKLLSQVAVLISDIKGFVMDMDETVEMAGGLKRNQETQEFERDSENAHGALERLVKLLEEYVTTVHGR